MFNERKGKEKGHDKYNYQNTHAPRVLANSEFFPLARVQSIRSISRGLKANQPRKGWGYCHSLLIKPRGIMPHPHGGNTNNKRKEKRHAKRF